MNILTPCQSSFYLKTQPCKIRIHHRSSSKNLTTLPDRPLVVPNNPTSNIRIRKVLTNTSIITRKVIRLPQNQKIVTNVSPIKGKTESFMIDDEDEDIKKLVKLF